MQRYLPLGKIAVVLDLTFGDGGKGMLTDTLCTSYGDPTNTIAIRFSGGHQAGHNVVKSDGRTHVHASFPSGTLSGYPGYLTEHCVVYPPGMRVEHEAFIANKVNPQLFVHPLAIVTTPYDIQHGQHRERTLKHGSCGVGIGATMLRHTVAGVHKLHVVDLFNQTILRHKLRGIADSLVGDGVGVPDEVIEDFIADCNWYIQTIGVAGYDVLSHYTNLVFEGSQGILLDKDHGTFPNVTFANTTSKNVFDTLAKIGKTGSIEMFYVTRAYQTRHGNGPMTDERDLVLRNNELEINVSHPWQGNFRVGLFDPNLVTHGLLIDMSYYDQRTITTNLVLTCIDQLESFHYVGGDDSTYLYKLIETVADHVDNVFVSDSPMAGIRRWNTI